MAIPDDYSIAPAFGRLPEPIWQIIPDEYEVQHTHTLREHTPPDELKHMHEPCVLDQLWCRVLALVREPVRVHADPSGRRMVELLGQQIVEMDGFGHVRVRSWSSESLGQGKLSVHSSISRAEDVWPLGYDWVDGLANGMSLEVMFWAKRIRRDAKPWAVNQGNADAYTAWALNVFRAQMAEHCDLELMDRKVRRALGIPTSTTR